MSQSKEQPPFAHEGGSYVLQSDGAYKKTVEIDKPLKDERAEEAPTPAPANTKK